MKNAYMVQVKELDVPVPPVVAAGRVSKYLEDTGYRAIGASEFERGSSRGTPFAFSPKKWHSVVHIEITGSEKASHLKASFDIDTTGQW